MNLPNEMADYCTTRRPRAVVWKQFGSLLVDLVFVPLALFVFICPWRTEAHTQCMHPPMCACIQYSVGSVSCEWHRWRTLSLISLLTSGKRGMARRCKAIKLFFSTLVDVPFILAALLLICISFLTP